MKDKKIQEIYLNWKGLEFIHSCKQVSKTILIALSIVFIIISVGIDNQYILAGSLIVLFLQILSENNKEYYLKYKDIYERIKKEGINIDSKEWIDFLEKTKGINSFYKYIFRKMFLRKSKNKK